MWTRQECNQCSRTPVQSSRIGLALWWLIILPGWLITPVGPGKDTHGTPVPNSGKAVGGPIRRSASQQLIDTKCKSCCTESKENRYSRKRENENVQKQRRINTKMDTFLGFKGREKGQTWKRHTKLFENVEQNVKIYFETCRSFRKNFWEND